MLTIYTCSPTIKPALNCLDLPVIRRIAEQLTGVKNTSHDKISRTSGNIFASETVSRQNSFSSRSNVSSSDSLFVHRSTPTSPTSPTLVFNLKRRSHSDSCKILPQLQTGILTLTTGSRVQVLKKIYAAMQDQDMNALKSLSKKHPKSKGMITAFQESHEQLRNLSRSNIEKTLAELREMVKKPGSDAATVKAVRIAVEQRIDTDQKLGAAALSGARSYREVTAWTSMQPKKFDELHKTLSAFATELNQANLHQRMQKAISAPELSFSDA